MCWPTFLRKSRPPNFVVFENGILFSMEIEEDGYFLQKLLAVAGIHGILGILAARILLIFAAHIFLVLGVFTHEDDLLSLRS